MHTYRSVGQRRPRRLAVVLWCNRTLPSSAKCYAMPCHAMRHGIPARRRRSATKPGHRELELYCCPLQLPLPTAHTVYRTCCMRTQPNTYAQRVCVYEAVKQAGNDDLTSSRHIATFSAACTTWSHDTHTAYRTGQSLSSQPALTATQPSLGRDGRHHGSVAAVSGPGRSVPSFERVRGTEQTHHACGCPRASARHGDDLAFIRLAS